MLHELSISHLGVIEQARIDLGPGFTVVTGETGAGKTMVLTGLGLILGAKSVKAVVRTGADEALAQAVLAVPDESEAAAALAEAGVAREDDGSVVIARTVAAATRSRSVAGGRTVPQALLSQVADELVTVHGQSDQVRLRSSARQRDTLDGYAGEDHARILDAYHGAWTRYSTAAQAVTDMERGVELRRAKAQALRDDLAAIDEVDPQPGEDDVLASQIAVLENSEAVRRGVSSARQAVGGEHESSVEMAVESARRALDEAARHDPDLQALEQRLTELRYLAQDIGLELTRYLDALDASPGVLDELHERRSDLAQLMRRLGTDFEGVIEHREVARDQVALDDNWDQELDARRIERDGAWNDVGELAKHLTQSRQRYALGLAADVNRELAQLAMPDAQFAIAVEASDHGPKGADLVTMVLAAHPGAQPRPVAQAASGGELSRIMLAIEVSLAHGNASPGHTFVFDEVDAGVGGKAAVAVGSRLAELARTHQVIVVTHLAQVAAFAQHHVVVHKATDGHTTQAHVRRVDGEDRVQEIARLLSGQEDSDTARAHAEELLRGSVVRP